MPPTPAPTLQAIQKASAEGRHAVAAELSRERVAANPEDADAHFYLGYSLRVTKEFEQAGQALRAAMAKFPGDVRYKNEIGMIHSDRREYPRALEIFTEVLRCAPENLFAHQWKIAILRLMKRFPEADQAIVHALAVAPGDPNIRCQRALWHYDQGQMDQALAILAPLAREHPEQTFYLDWMINTLRALGRVGEIGPAVEASLAASPRNLGLKLTLGRWQYEMGRCEQALETFDKILEVEPDNLDALEWRIISLRSMDRFPEAEAAIRAGTRKFPESNRFLFQSGLMNYQRQQYLRALSDFDEVLRLSPGLPVAYEWKISMLRILKRFPEADLAIEEGLQKTPGDPGLRAQRALWHYDQGRYPEALEILGLVIRDLPKNERIHDWKIMVLRALRQFEAARKAIDEGLREVPGSPAIGIQKALWHFDQGQYEESLRVLNDVLQSAPRNLLALEWKFSILRQLRRFPEADRGIEAALQQLPDSSLLRFVRGQWLHDQGRFDEAAATFRATLERSPKYTVAWEWLIYTLRETRQHVEARKAIQDALRELPGDTIILNQEAALLMLEGRYREALSTLERVLAVNRADNLAHCFRIQILRILKRFKEAAQAIDVALPAVTERHWILQEQANLHWDQGHLKEAAAVFRQILSENPRNEAARIGLIGVLRFSHDRRQAAEECRLALSQLGEMPSLLNEQGLLQYQQEQYADAVATFNRTLEIDPNNQPAARFILAALAESRREDRFAEFSSTLLAKHPGNPEILAAVGRGYMAMKRPDPALPMFEKAVELAPAAIRHWLDRARCLYSLSRDAEAEAGLQTLAERHEAGLEVSRLMGWLYLERHETAKAEELFLKVLTRNATDLDTSLALGCVYLETERAYAAEERFREIIREQPGYAIALRNRAWALLKRSDELADPASAASHRKLSRDCCLKALDLLPNDVLTYKVLGNVAYKDGEMEKAETYLQRAVTLDKNGTSQVELARLYLNTGRFEAAKKLLDEALKRDDADPQTRLELGNYYLRVDNDSSAVAEFRIALGLQPDFEQAAHGMAIGLMRKGAFVEAGNVLKSALALVPDDNRRWRLHLRLAELHIRMGDKEPDKKLKHANYEEALKYVLRTQNAAYYHAHHCLVAGIVRLRLGDHAKALELLEGCLEAKPNLFEAERHVLRLRQTQRDEGAKSFWIAVGGWAVALLSGALLIAFWGPYLWALWTRGPSGQEPLKPETALAVLTPVLMAFILISSLLPWLTHLKVTGLEVDINLPKAELPLDSMADFGFDATLNMSMMDLQDVGGRAITMQTLNRMPV